MDNLIKALTIFRKYKNNDYPTMCDHDILMIADITEEEVSEDDKAELDKLGFSWNKGYSCWSSYIFGAA